MADLYALHWNAVTHANEYTVEVNPGGSGWATLGTTSGTQYTVVNTSTAYQSNIKYRVKAKDTTGVYDDSPYSEELSITYYSITNTLTNCTSDNIQQMVANGFTYNSIITVSDGYIIGSDNWNITIGGTSDKTKGTLSSDGKTLNVAILSANGNIVITASAALEAPAAPTITLTGSTISWAAVTGATGYRIIATADVAKQTDITSTSFDLSTWSDLTAGTWTVRVLSTNGTVYSDSSNTVTYTIQNKLATPTVAMNADGKTLEITDVENATSYDVYVDGVLKTNVARPDGYTILVKNYTPESVSIWVNKPDGLQGGVTNGSKTFNNVKTMQFYTSGNYYMNYETTAGTPESGTVSGAIFANCTFNQSGEVTISKGEHV